MNYPIKLSTTFEVKFTLCGWGVNRRVFRVKLYRFVIYIDQSIAFHIIYAVDSPLPKVKNCSRATASFMREIFTFLLSAVLDAFLQATRK